MENAAPNQEELRTAYGENVETRTMELRAADSDGDLMVLEGFAANFEQETDLGYFKEKIARGAFEGRMEDDVRYLLNHKGVPMARTSNGTLELEVREEGLYTRAVLNDTSNKDVYKAVKRGDITSMSFAFTIAEDEIDVEKNLRTVTKVEAVRRERGDLPSLPNDQHQGTRRVLGQTRGSRRRSPNRTHPRSTGGGKTREIRNA